MRNMSTIQTNEIEMVPVSSSNLEEVGFDRKSKTLRIKFHDSRTYYDFQNVPSRVYDALMKSKSKGEYFRDEIQPRYNFKKAA